MNLKRVPKMLSLKLKRLLTRSMFKLYFAYPDDTFKKPILFSHGDFVEADFVHK
jgi:hypothetical protein